MQLSASTLRTLRRLLGSKNVHTDEVSLALNGYDCSPSRHRPDAVLTICDAAQLVPLLQLLSKEKIPFIARAAATNHAGSCAAVRGGVVLNLNPLCALNKIDTERGLAEAEPGLVTGDLQNALNPLEYFYAPDPASERVSTLGGNLAQNASGARCLKYGNTANNTLQISFLTPDGKEFILRHDTPGPDLLGLVAGSEGTLGIIKNIQVKIQPVAPHIQTFLIAFPSIENSVQTVTDLVAQGLIPRCMEAMDQLTIRTVENFTHAGYPDVPAILILELDGEDTQIKKDAKTLQTVCQKNHCLSFLQAQNEQERQNIWRGRRAAYAAMAALAPNVAVGDGTVPRSELPNALKKVRRTIEQNDVTASLLFHAGDGNFHPQIVFNGTITEQTRRVQKTLQEILKTCVDHGGTISGEHGIGIEKRALMTYEYSRQTLRLFQHIKNAFDPDHLANPEKIIPVDFESRAADTQVTDAAVLSLSADIKRLFDTGKQAYICGAGTQTTTDENGLSTRALNKIIEIDKINYTATVQAGARVTEVLKALHTQKTYSFLPDGYPGTLGGLLASKISLPFALQVTGIEAILPNADVVRYGGKIMKNAAGYNLCRLFTGSWGALGLITQITFKIYATPQQVLPLTKQNPQAANELFCALKKEIDPRGVFLSPVFKEDKK